MKIMLCNFNMDTGCVELKFFDGSMLSIDCTGGWHNTVPPVGNFVQQNWNRTTTIFAEKSAPMKR